MFRKMTILAAGVVVLVGVSTALGDGRHHRSQGSRRHPQRRSHVHHHNVHSRHPAHRNQWNGRQFNQGNRMTAAATMQQPLMQQFPLRGTGAPTLPRFTIPGTGQSFGLNGRARINVTNDFINKSIFPNRSPAYPIGRSTGPNAALKSRASGN
jgi:hypothetical protein